MVRVVLLATVMAAAGGSFVQQQQVFRVGADIVPVYATVTDRSGRLVPDLVREDFEIRDNGKPQEITVFDNSPQPIKLIVMLDVSGSMEGNVKLLQLASEQLFANLLPGDEVKVGTFGQDIWIMPTFTNSVAALRAALPADIPSGPTPLWRAVDRALGAFGDARGRRVVLVLSDGENAQIGFGRQYNALDVVDRAQREDVMLYGIGIRPRNQGFGQMPSPELPRAAADTGGGFFDLQPREDLGAVFARVADELHRQYMIGFAPPAKDGKLHRLEVRVKKDDMRPRARKNYLAPQK